MTGFDREAIRGKSVLVVEDEPLVGLMVEDILADSGCDAIVVSTYDEALEKASTLPVQLAILDINLNGRQIFPIAEMLAKRRLPFVFATGYATTGIPASFESVPVVRKPFNQHDLESALGTALASVAR
jgi:CheY-like chemotaxis protein